MASRLVRQPISRSGAFRRVQAPRNAQFGAKRTMSSTGGAPKAKSDLPWIIGSAVVFGPAVSSPGALLIVLWLNCVYSVAVDSCPVIPQVRPTRFRTPCGCIP